MPDSLEDNIIENSLECSPGVGDSEEQDASGVHADDNAVMSPPKRSRARFLESDGEDENTDPAEAPAKRTKLADSSKASIVAESTQASVRKLANFAFAK